MPEWPKCSSSLVFLWEALLIAGRAKFGADWTGQELNVLDWPVSPNSDSERQVEQEKKLAAQTRPALKLGSRSPPVPGSILLHEDFSSHVWAQRLYVYTRTQQIAWEANRSALARLRETSQWLHDQFRNSLIPTFAREVGTPSEPVALPPNEWYCENTFASRFATGQYKRWLHQPSRLTAVYIFVDHAALEAAISTLPNANAVFTTADLLNCSPYLRFAVAFSLKHCREIHGWPRESLWRQIRDDWNASNPADPMFDTMAKRMSHVVSQHDPEAIAAGKKALLAKKTGVTPKTAESRQFLWG